jgi:serine/threonine protein kinase
MPGGVAFVKNRIGSGVFGTVYQGVFTFDKQNNKIPVAIKVSQVVSGSIANTRKFNQALKEEASILELLSSHNKSGNIHTADLITKGPISKYQFCIIQSLHPYGNLYDTIRKTNHIGLPLAVVGSFAHQLLLALNFLRDSKIKIIHCDIKPENILITSKDLLACKLIDFGTSIKAEHAFHASSYIVSRFYRPPEVVFNMVPDYNLDLWSLGCVLFEATAGQPLFPAQSSDELLWMIAEFLGEASQNFVKQIPNYNRYFRSSSARPGQYNYIGPPPVIRQENRREFFERKLVCLPKGEPGDLTDFETKENSDGVKNLILKMLKWDPKERLSPSQLLETDAFLNAVNIFLPHIRALGKKSEEEKLQVTQSSINLGVESLHKTKASADLDK